MKINTFILMFLLLCSNGYAGQDLTGKVIRVIDGDTIKVELQEEMPPLFKIQSIRLLHCDTPEKKSTNPELQELAWKATAFTKAKVAEGTLLELKDVHFDKYGGRLLSSIVINGEDLCQALINEGLAHRYEGGKKDWE